MAQESGYRKRWIPAANARAGLFLSLLLTAAPGCAEEPPPRETPKTAYIAIIIDDLGNSLREGRHVIHLPGPVACAILPHTAHSRHLAREAHARNKEVLLHLPMESLDQAAPGPGVLDSAMPERELEMTLDYDLETVPHAVGVNNHMGSLLTQQARAMRFLMQAISRRGNLFFVDSRTSPDSLAAQTASEHGVPALARNVFLDNERAPEAIEQRLEELVSIARRKGSALAIGHPYAETLEVLERWLPTLSDKDIQLVPLSVMLTKTSRPKTQTSRKPENATWQPYSFR